MLENVKLKQLFTLGETLVGQRHLTRQKIEVETTEDAAERRDGDETVGSTRLQQRRDVEKLMNQQLWTEMCNRRLSVASTHSDKSGCFPGVTPSHHPPGLHGQLVHRLATIRTRTLYMKTAPERARIGLNLHAGGLYWREWAAPALAPGYRRWLWPPRRNSAAAQSHDQKKPERCDRERRRRGRVGVSPPFHQKLFVGLGH